MSTAEATTERQKAPEGYVIVHEQSLRYAMRALKESAQMKAAEGDQDGAKLEALCYMVLNGCLEVDGYPKEEQWP